MNKAVYWLFGISIVLIIISICLNISNLVVTNESIVLVFVGILATFIVVGNFAQVTEIRNSTNKQISDLESNTQEKIAELNQMYGKVIEATEKINKVERRTYFNAAEGYRLYGLYTYDTNSYRDSTAYLINAIVNYNKADHEPTMLDSLLNLILRNLDPELWNKKDQQLKFNYKRHIANVKKFPDTYDQKQLIIEKLEQFSKEKIV